MTAPAGPAMARRKRKSAVRRNKALESILAMTAALGFTTGSALGQGMTNGIMSPPASVRPPGLNHVGIQQNLNQPIPLELMFKDDLGRSVRLGDYFRNKPVILNLVYYNCPMLCGEVLSGLEHSLRMMKLDVGKDFDVITVSFDPRETPEMAAKKKAEYLKRYKRAGAEQGWHFLVGQQDAIDALTRAAGFQYQYDEKTRQFAHATAILIVTPEGRIAQYYYGVEYPPKDLRLGLVEAGQSRIGNVVDQLLLYCYHYDPTQGKYSATILGVLRLAGVATMLSLGTLIFVMIRRGPAHDAPGAGRVR
jgi:protein SCO1/2